MLVIRQTQMEALHLLMLRRFEDRLLDRIAQDFDRQYALLGRDQMREVVRLGVKRAEVYGLAGDDLVLPYVALMLMLGARFDEDPQLPWAREGLAAPATASAVRLDRVYGAAMEHLDRVAGPENERLVRALVRLRDFDLTALAALPVDERVEAIAAALARLYPEKAAAQGVDATREVVARAVALAEANGVHTGMGAALCGGLAFMVGSGFADDPQVPWVARTLALPCDEGEKTAALHREVVAFVAFGLGEGPR